MAIIATDNAYWLGKVPDDWGIARIGDYYKLRNEKVSDRDYPPLSVTMKGIVPQLATAAKTDDHDNRKLVRKGDFAINSRSDRRGSCGISDFDGSVSLINTVLTPRGEMNPKYYDWLFHTEQFADEFYKWGHGIVDDLWTTRWQEMKSILIVSPPLEEQQAIAAYLDDRCSRLDEIITEAEKSIEEYKELKRAVIFEAVTQGLDKNVPMKDSDIEWIGNIPTSWTLVRIPRILDYRSNYPLGDGDHGMIKTEDYQNDGIPYIRVQNLDWGTDLLLDNVVYISEENNEKIKSSQLKPNDVLFCKTGGTIGKTGMVPENLPISNTTSHVGKITVNPAYNARYVFYVLSSNVGYRQFWEIACQKTTRPELSIAETRQIRLTWPSSRKEQDDIVQYLDSIIPEYDALISEKLALINDLQAYKKSLIYEVVTGKRRVV